MTSRHKCFFSANVEEKNGVGFKKYEEENKIGAASKGHTVIEIIIELHCIVPSKIKTANTNEMKQEQNPPKETGLISVTKALFRHYSYIFLFSPSSNILITPKRYNWGRCVILQWEKAKYGDTGELIVIVYLICRFNWWTFVELMVSLRGTTVYNIHKAEIFRAF